MVANNKVDSLSYDVEAPPPLQGAASSGAAPPPAPAHHHHHNHAAPVMPAPAVVELHKVSLPERRSTAKALRQRLAEVFFPDDPLHQFKNQSSARRLVLALQYFFPIFQWGSAYNARLLRSDLVAGLTIASLAIPQGISYAKLANLPPIIGLYSSFVPPLIYSLLGSSRDLAVGPVSIASLVMGSMLREAVSPDEQPMLYLQLAFTSTFFAGVFQASLGFLRLGFIVDFLSKPTLTGFMGGAAIIVSLQQLKGLLGIVHFTSHMGFVDVMRSVFKRHDEWEWQTITMGTAFLAILLMTRQISARNPKLFWVSAGAPLTSVIISTILSFIWKSHSISVIGILPRGVNPPSANMLTFSGSYVALTIKTGIMTGILSLTHKSKILMQQYIAGRDCGGQDVRIDQQLPGGRQQGDDGDRCHEHGGLLRVLLRDDGLILPVGGELQRRVQDGGVQHRDGGGGAGDAPLPDAAVPLHPQRDPVGDHHHGGGRAHRRRRRRPALEGGQAGLPGVHGGVPGRAARVRAGGARRRRRHLAVQDPAAGDTAKHGGEGPRPRHAELPQRRAVQGGRQGAGVPRRRRRVGDLLRQLHVPRREGHEVPPGRGGEGAQGKPELHPMRRPRHERRGGDRHERSRGAVGAEESPGQKKHRAGARQPCRIRCREDVQLGGGRAVRVRSPVLQCSGGGGGGGVQSAALIDRPASRCSMT